MIKHTLRSCLLTLCALTGLGAATVLAQPPDFVQLADQLKPAVVNISTSQTVQQRSPFMPRPGMPGNDMFEEFFERF